MGVGSADGTARIYDLGGALVRTLHAGQALLTHLAFSPDGRLLAAGSNDRTSSGFAAASVESVRLDMQFHARRVGRADYPAASDARGACRASTRDGQSL